MKDYDDTFTPEGKEVAVKQGSSPAEMIRVAVGSGADLEELEKLLTLQERFEANEARKAYHKAMAEFKENPPKIEKDKTVKYKEVRYNHASLANVVDKITKELSKHGFSASWSTKQNGDVIVTCRITHRMGHSEQTTLSAPSDTSGSKNAIQAIGSTISYLQRYTLLSAVGLATSDMDNDGAGTEAEKISEKQLSNILDLLNSIDQKEAPLLKFLKIDKLEDLPKSDYQKAISAIEARAGGKNENL